MAAFHKDRRRPTVAVIACAACLRGTGEQTIMLAALAAAIVLQAAPASDPCAYDREAMLALSPEAFDQDLDGGWRMIAAVERCREAAADLLSAYREAHWGQLKVGDLHTNYWHEGQIRASIGQTRQAVRLMMAGVNPQFQTDGFHDYALGTIAFLNRDRPALEAARARLAAAPMPPDFEESRRAFQEKYGLQMEWPMNLGVLDGLIACFDKTYSEAYDRACRP